MKIVACSALLLALAATLALLSPTVAWQVSPKTEETVERICRSVEDYEFCCEVFNRDLFQPGTDILGLTKITLVEAKTNVTNTLVYIQNQMLVIKDPIELSHYSVCEEAYQKLKISFDQAFAQFEKGDYKGMAASEEDTPTIQAPCTTVFIIPRGKKHPFIEKNREMEILIAMAVVTGRILNT